MKHSTRLIPLSVACISGVILTACMPGSKTETDSTGPTPLPASLQTTEQAQQQLVSTSIAHSMEKRRFAGRVKSKDMSTQYFPGLYPQDEQRENYQHFTDNGIFKSNINPVSTFSVDVDTGAYSNVRRFLNQGQLPQRDAVRSEELINYFNYSYEYPENKKQPFSITTEIAPTPWNKHSYLLHIGLQAFQSPAEQRPASNLVFLVDVSGSMHSRNKLQLLKSGLKMMVKNLNENDSISIVTYAGSTAVVLKPIKGNQRAEISMALEQLTAGGSTNGASGIKLAYQMAQQSFIENGINRIILATDGDFNMGVTSFESLKQIVEEKRKTGISLTTLGFGQGNYNDHLMEQLADAGNGNYSYIDNLNEARKVLVEEMGSTLNTVANDVKIQIEFNPQQVAEYRLIGYENRTLQQEDFNNDKVDAGDIGESHSVTALYEVTFTDSQFKQLDNNRYAQPLVAKSASDRNNELAFLRLRYKANSQSASQLIEKPVYLHEVTDNISQASNNFRFSASVAAFAQQLRGGKYLHDFNYNDILQLARQSKGDDTFGYRSEFIQLIALAQQLGS